MADAALGADEFTAVFAQRGRALWLVAAAWVGRTDAQDLVQEAARIAWQKRASFAVGSDLAAWLAQIVRHTGANWRRKRRPVADGDLPEPAARAEGAPVLAFDADRWQLPDDLARALHALPEAARAALLLHVVAELPFAVIATMLDMPENTVTSLARRARLALRATLAAPSPAAPAPADPNLPPTVAPAAALRRTP
ncbi:MAG: RNA polymerase sigma factor [Planctomycetota bacterium]|jgi:RNA polymerase sigma factor (sigma-70 family)